MKYRLSKRNFGRPTEGRWITFKVHDSALADVHVFYGDTEVEPPTTRSPRVANWEADARALEDPEAIVAARRPSLVVTYPLRVEATFDLVAASNAGFTRRALLEAIGAIYAWVYEEEERTATVARELVTKGGNVSETGGTFGIWGHPLEHLCLGSAWASTDAAGQETIWLEISS